MTSNVFANAFGGGTGGGAGFQLFTQTADNQPAIYANAAARDVYFTANPNDLTILDSSEFLIIKLNDNGSGEVAYQQRQNNAWVDVTSLIQGEQGIPGDAATVADLTALQVPVKSATEEKLVDSGLRLDNGDLITERSIQAGTGSFRIGPSFTMSNGVQAVAFNLGDGTSALGLNMEYNSNGSTQPFFYKLAAEDTLDVNLVQDTVLSDPFNINYTTFGDNLTTDFDIVPNEAGELRVRFWQGTDNTGELIFDETRTIETSEINTPISFGIGNPYILAGNLSLFATFEGVALRGGTVTDPDSPFNGQTIPYFRSTVHGYTETTLATQDELTDHPVTLRRDMPTQEDARELAEGSLNGNSALWVTSTEQLANSNRADATIYALMPNQLDADGNEISQTPVAANTVRLTGGTIVRIFGENDFRVVVSSEQSVNAEEVRDIVATTLVAGTNVTINNDDANDTITISSTGGSGSANKAEIGALTLDIAPRVNLDTTLTGERQVRFRVYNHAEITSLSLFVDEGGLFSTHALTVPTADGTQTQTVTIPSLTTSTAKTISFYLIANGNIVSNSYIVRVEDIDGDDVVIDSASLAEVTANDAQDVATELNRLFGIVRGIQNERATPSRPLQTFENSVTIGATNLADFINRNAIYVASTDKRVGFTLPSEAVIGSQYPAIFEISHFGGTQRFDSGFNPNNTIRINRPTDYDANDPSTFLRRSSTTGSNLQFAELHRGDTAIITKQDANSPWVVVESSTDPRTSILPDGVFQLNSRGVTFPLNVNGDHVIGGLTLYTPNQGDAFQVTGSGITEDSTFGRAIETGDVIVAKQDNPSLLLDENNDDWLIIRDAGHSEITLTELRFLAQISEADSFSDSRLIDRSDVTAVRLWLASGVLDHAPFISPSTDPDNPQDDGVTYVGGDEKDGTDFEFRDTANRPNNLVYVDIDGSFSTDQLNTIFMVIKDRDGAEISRYNLNTQFKTVTLTGSSDTYYALDTVSASDNFSTINYLNGYTIDIVQRNTNRQFNFNDNVNVLSAIADDSITISKLEPNAQALLQADHSLTDAEDAKLEGLETSGTATTWTAGELYVKLGADLPSNELSSYQNVGQQNGILSNFERTTPITFLVPNFVNVTNLARVDDNTSTVAVTPIGTILGRQAFTATLPAATATTGYPLPPAYAVNGTASNLVLSGANATFKIDRENLSDNLEHAIFDETPANALPDILTALSNDLSRTVRTTSGWRRLPLGTQYGLTREAAWLWDNNLRTNAGNEFDDITNTEAVGYTANEVFYYADANDQYNTGFPGHHSYILNDNIRIRNAAGGTTIQDTANKIMMFDYSLQRPINTNENFSMVRAGDTSSTPLMGISHDEGLYLNIGRSDGGTQTRTYDSFFEVDNHQWHSQVGQTVNTEAEIIIPSDLTGSLTVNIDVRLSNNGNDEGTHRESVTITNLGSDQSFGNRNFSYSDVDGEGNTHTEVLAINYDAVNTDLPNTRRVLFIRTTVPLSNAAFTYDIRASRSVTETWNVATTYARYPVNSGNPHDRFGLFDPALWNTERVRTPEHVAIMLRPYRLGDTSSNPEMAAFVVVDGEHEGDASNGRLIRLHRPKSDFDTSDVNFGNSICGVSHIQMYNYTSDTTPTEAQFFQLVTGEDAWLNAFTDRTETTDRFILNGDLEIDSKLLLKSTGTQILKTLEVEDDNTVVVKNA